MTKPLNELQLDHANFMKLLAVLEQELSVFERGDHPDYEIILKIADYFADYSERFHHPLENAIFAQLKERDRKASEKVGDLEREHEQATEEVSAFKEAAEAVLREAEMPRETFEQRVRRFIDKERAHIAMEEQVFFPQARTLLRDEDWDSITSGFSMGKDPLFSSARKAEFRDLADLIQQWEREAQEARAGALG
ncbi:MAG: hemerythrin domain-containing protein [Limibacillus sp.]|jgi:hemerythrin-like domain-containing protein